MAKSIDRVVDDNTIRAYYDKLSSAPHWMEDAECYLNDDGTLNPIEDPETIAEKYCPTCPVIDQCRTLGDMLDIKHGVFGGIVRNPEN